MDQQYDPFTGMPYPGNDQGPSVADAYRMGGLAGMDQYRPAPAPGGDEQALRNYLSARQQNDPMTHYAPAPLTRGQRAAGALASGIGDFLTGGPIYRAVDAANTLANISPLSVDESGNSVYDAARDRLARSALDTTAYAVGPGTAFAPRSAVGIFGGRLAQTADQGALKQARSMAKAGESPYIIRDVTGFEQRPDKKWRFEINDRDATINQDALARAQTVDAGTLQQPGYNVAPPQPGTTLGEVMSHPDLYAAYPQLENLPVRTFPARDPFGEPVSTLGGYSPSERAFYLRAGMSPEEMRSVLLHEVQHGVQGIEGFAAGGSPTDRAVMLRADQNVTQTQAAMESRIEQLRNGMWDWIGKNTPQGEVNAATIKQWRQANPALVVEQDRLYGSLENPGIIRNDARIDAYRNLLGEAEARNVAARADLTPEQRFLLRPEVTEDIARADQWVKRQPKMGDVGSMIPPDAMEARTPLQSFPFRRNDGSTFTIKAANADEARVKAQAIFDQAEADARAAARAGSAPPQGARPLPGDLMEARAPLEDNATLTRAPEGERWRMGSTADQSTYPPPTGSMNPLDNVPVTFRGKEPKNFTPEDWQAFGEHYGVPDLGPLSPLQSFKDASGNTFNVPGGTGGKWTYYDLLHMKANPINPSQIDPALHIDMQRKLGRTMTPDPLTDEHVWNGLVFGMTSPNNPLLPNQLTASRLRLRTPEMLDDLASMAPQPNAEGVVPAAARKLANDQIAQRYALGAAPEGLGSRGTTDYSRVADMARMFRQDPSFFRKAPDETWLQAVERISSQVPGLSAKTGSFGTVWQDPARAAISAVDRHMMKELDARGGVFASDAERMGWQNRALTDWNRKYPDDPATSFADILTKRGSDGYIGERLMNHINQPNEPQFRVARTGEINPSIPPHLAQANWVNEPEKVTMVGRAYKQALDVNQRLAQESGLDLFPSQWMLWDRIRNRFEPHENMFPGLSNLPALSVDQMRAVANQHTLTGHKTYTKTEGRLPPTKPLTSGLPSSMGYLGMGGVAAMPALWPQNEEGQ